MPSEEVESVAERVSFLVDAGAVRRARLALVQLHPADQAAALGELDPDIRRTLLENLTDNDVVKIAEYLDEAVRPELIPALGESRVVAVLSRLQEDLAADLIQDLPEEAAHDLLERLGDKRLEEIVSYEEESAGGRMSANVVLLHDFWTIERAIEFLRRSATDLRQQVRLFVVDDYDKLVGTITPGHLVMYPGRLRLDQIMEKDPVTVPVGYDQEAAAETMRHYNLLSLPVVDEEMRVRGVLTADDVLDIQIEEATEDIFHLAGLPDQERIFRPIRQAVPVRFAWLTFNLGTAFIAAITVSFFEGTIERAAMLAIFMPMVAGMAGNAGLQTLTLVVRSIALREIGPEDGVRVLLHEAAVAVINGLAIGLLVGIVASLWQGSAWLGLIVAVALLANIANAVTIGVIVPLALSRLKLDPALSSGVIVMLADVFGFLVFLGLGTLLLSKIT